jgi:mono/diheme cytochrome c family protein
MSVFVRTMLLAFAVSFLVMVGTQTPTTADSPVYADAAKIFTQHCISCHSGPRAPEKLRLDTYKDVMQGGKAGAVIVPKDPAKSELIKRVKGTSKPRMPKNGPPWLSDDEIKTLDKWVENGAPEA